MSELSPTSLATKIERSENKLTEALTRCNVSVAGQAWIDHAFDLFKDRKNLTPCVGQPDRSARNIYVSTYTSQLTISRPATVPAGSTWDCHIMNLQQNNLTTVHQTAMLNNNSASTLGIGIARNYGGIQILAGPAGPALGFAHTVGNIYLPDTYFRGQNSAKVIGKAHEILNTTNALNVQGDLLYYQKTLPDPQDTITGMNWVGPSATDIVYNGSLDYYNNLSSFDTPDTLIVLPKTGKHLAKDGIYQTCVLASSENKAQIDRPLGQMVRGLAGSVHLTIPDWTTSVATTVPALHHGSPEIPAVQSPFVSPFNVSGSYLTGLSSETTLTITGKWLVEVSPEVSDTKMISLCHMNPPEDKCANEIYSQIAYALDAGTKIKNNADGDWIATVADLAVEFGIPGSGIIRKGVNLARDFYSGGGFASMVNPSSNQGNKNSNQPKLKSFRNGNASQKQWDDAANFNSNRKSKNNNNKKKKPGNKKATNNKNLNKGNARK